MPADLHVHSTCSDGSTPIGRLPVMAARLGLSAIALTDHDSLLSMRYAYAHPVQDGVELIPGAELSARDTDTGRRVHLLALWPRECAALAAHCENMANQRNALWGQSAKELEAVYPQFRAEMAWAYANAGGPLFKSGIMQALGELGLVRGGIYGETYKSIFGKEGFIRRKPVYDTVDKVLDTMRQSGAAVVFAHPSVYKSMDTVRRLAAAGRIDGIEVYHPRNTPQDQAECLALCDRYGLAVTGGTDFHGANSQTPNPLGTCQTADDQLERLRSLAAGRK